MKRENEFYMVAKNNSTADAQSPPSASAGSVGDTVAQGAYFTEVFHSSPESTLEERNPLARSSEKPRFSDMRPPQLAFALVEYDASTEFVTQVTDLGMTGEEFASLVMSTKSPAEAKEALGEFTGIPIMRWMFLWPRVQMEMKAAHESEDVSRETGSLAPPSSREQDAGCPPDASMVEALAKALSRENDKDKARYFRASVVKEFGAH